MAGYIVCYDIRDRRRLQRVHRSVVRAARRLQWSVYYFEGGRASLLQLIHEIEQLMSEEDDLRVYPAPRTNQLTLLAPSQGGVWLL